MENKYYKILGVSKDATNEEIEIAYQTLKTRYQKERFEDGEVGNHAAKMLTEIENAYNIILSLRKEQDTSTFGIFSEIENDIKKGDLQSAQEKLDSFNERDSEWHYYQSVVFYKKNWINESKLQLEIAIRMNPNEQKYKNALDKIQIKINGQDNAQYNAGWDKSGNAYKAPNQEDQPIQQMGGDSCCQWCCEMAICNAMFNIGIQCCCPCR